MSRTAHLWLRLDASRGSMSLRALAKEIGCSPSSLTRWSQGKAPSAEVALAATEWIARLPPADADLGEDIQKLQEAMNDLRKRWARESRHPRVAR